MTTIHLNSKMVPAAMRGGYDGKKFKAVVCTEYTVPSDAGLWSGGSRDHWYAIELASGTHVALPGQRASPWNSARRDTVVPLKSGYALVRHSHFCGKDMGLTFYVHPDNAAALLPAPAAELTDHERIVLQATCSLKSSYMGRDRFEMAQRGSEYEHNGYGKREAFPTREQWDAAKASLIGKGLLNKAGAVTVAGRNARPSKY